MALENYIKPEQLTEDNQYFCESCDHKVDADKGIKLISVPSTLTLVLRRFGLNYETFTREKINNSVSFGQLLNMNEYINTSEAESKLYEKEIEL